VFYVVMQRISEKHLPFRPEDRPAGPARARKASLPGGSVADD
jgi:hypothetical protein